MRRRIRLALILLIGLFAPFCSYKFILTDCKTSLTQHQSRFQWLENFSLPESGVNGTRQYSVTFLISPLPCQSNTVLLVLVPSAVRFRDYRLAVRETWGGAIRNNAWPRRNITNHVVVVFLLGIDDSRSPNWTEEVREESRRYNDVIHGDFVDTFDHLTIKSIMGLHWANLYCPNVKYVLKSDNDVVPNVLYLLETLERKNYARTIMGTMHHDAFVKREGKYTVSKEQYPNTIYPDYHGGEAYLITGDVIAEMVNASRRVAMITIEDVYVTGLLAAEVNVNHVENPRFSSIHDLLPDPCTLITDEVFTVRNLVEPDLIRAYWKEIREKAKCEI